MFEGIRFTTEQVKKMELGTCPMPVDRVGYCSTCKIRKHCKENINSLMEFGRKLASGKYQLDLILGLY